MLKPTYELQAMDMFKHLNGDFYQVQVVDWIGDDAVVTCTDANDEVVNFIVDVHTQFNVFYSLKVGA